MSWREMAEICYIQYGRKPSHHSVKHIAESSPPPPLQARRYQPWHLIPDPAERKLAIIRLHSEGWSITSISEYLETTRHTVYDTLKRWADEGVAGLEPKSRARKGPRKVTLKVSNEVRKLQENPLLGKFRVHTALKRLGMEVSPTTCGRIMAKIASSMGSSGQSGESDQSSKCRSRQADGKSTGAPISVTSKIIYGKTLDRCMSSRSSRILVERYSPLPFPPHKISGTSSWC